MKIKSKKKYLYSVIGGLLLYSSILFPRAYSERDRESPSIVPDKNNLETVKNCPYFKNSVSGEKYYFVVYSSSVLSSKSFYKVLKEKGITDKISLAELCNYYAYMEAPEYFKGKGLPGLIYFQLRLGIEKIGDVKKIRKLYPNTSVSKDTEGYGPAGRGSFMIDFTGFLKKKEIEKIISLLKAKGFLKDDEFELRSFNSYLFLGSFLKKDKAKELKNRLDKLHISVKLLELEYMEADL